MGRKLRADDEQSVRAFLQQILLRSGYKVIVAGKNYQVAEDASNPEEAFKRSFERDKAELRDLGIEVVQDLPARQVKVLHSCRLSSVGRDSQTTLGLQRQQTLFKIRNPKSQIPIPKSAVHSSISSRE